MVWQENRLGPAAARVAHASVRVSAPLRRGAAPYADGSWRLVEARTHGSLLPFEVQSRTEGGIYVTFCVRQDTIKSSVQFGQSIPKYTYSPIQKGPVPYIPVAPLHESLPQDGADRVQSL